jgi:hypothetical protein
MQSDTAGTAGDYIMLKKKNIELMAGINVHMRTRRTHVNTFVTIQPEVSLTNQLLS